MTMPSSKANESARRGVAVNIRLSIDNDAMEDQGSSNDEGPRMNASLARAHVDGRPKKGLPPVKKSKRKAKAWDHPKRPLSAYNYFFQAERKAIISAINDAQGLKMKASSVYEVKDTKAKAKVHLAKRQVEDEEEPTEYAYSLDDETLELLLTPEGNISFDQVVKLIGRNWKTIDPVRLAKFEECAKQDRLRYEHEKSAFNLRHHARELRKQEQEYNPDRSNLSFGNMSGNIHNSCPLTQNEPAFSSNAMPSSEPFDLYDRYPYPLNQQPSMYYPPNYPGYGMDPYQVPRGTLMPTPTSGIQYTTYGREGYVSSDDYHYRGFESHPQHQRMEQHSSQEQAPPVNFPSQHYQGNHQGQAYWSSNWGSGEHYPPPPGGGPNT